MMDQLVERFPAQLQEAIATGAAANIRPHHFDIHNIFIAGMGGSGIGGDFIADFIRDECIFPVLICKDYEVPAYVGPNTLAIVSSYSGDTEEACAVFENLIKTGAKIVVISSGGVLLERARAEGVDLIKLPSDCPSPRACLGFAIVQKLFTIYQLGLISDKKIHEVVNVIALLEKEMVYMKTEAIGIAKFLKGKTPVIYSTNKLGAVALRFRQQINQNAKMLGWHNAIPEMNHNELVGWREEDENLAVIFLRSPEDHPRNQRRIEINKSIIQGYTNSIMEISAKGRTLVEQSLYLLNLCDWASVYLAEMKGVDAVKIKVVDYLKKEMGKAS
ncbi:MAG: bifunctional phosphoglucose/phosphomannose isomerase [Saprospiraceae bacterium]